MNLALKKPTGCNWWAFETCCAERSPHGTNGNALEVLPEAGM